MPGERPVSGSAAAATGRVLEPNRRALAPVDSNWYTAHELDSYPRALGPIRIAYPMALGEARVAARVLLWLRIDEHGEVFDVRAGEADTPERLIEAARAGIAAVRFAPARKDDRAVKRKIKKSIVLEAAGKQ